MLLVAAALSLLALAHTAGLLPIALITRLEAVLDDARLRAFAPQTRSTQIAIVDVDERSLGEIGRWPWPRDRMASLVEALAGREGAAAIGFDFVFSEPDDAALRTLGQLAEDDRLLAARLPTWQSALDTDGRFAAALRGQPVVLGYYFTSDRGGTRSGVLPAPLLAAADLGGRAPRWPVWDGYGANLPRFASAVPHAGFFNAMPDGDGLTRRLPIAAWHQHAVYGSLALTLLEAAQREPLRLRPELHPVPADPDRVDVGAFVVSVFGRPTRIALDADGAVRVPFRATGGPRAGSFLYVSAADVLSGRTTPGELKGRIVLIGSSAPGLADLRATPIHPALPGVEVHAHLIAGLLEGRVPVRPDWAEGFEAACTLLLLALLVLLVIFTPVRVAMAAGAAAIVALVGTNLVAYRQQALVLPLALPLTCATALFAYALGQGYLREWRMRRSLTTMFGIYVPPEVVRQMAREGMRADMHAENRELTVLFCDLRGFSRIAERLEPQDLRTLINLYLSRMSAVVRAHRGTLDKFIGDAVMAFWGAPIDDAAHARHAVDAALEMSSAIEPLNADLVRRGLPEVGVGIGLASGIVCVGDLGSDLRRSYTVVGDAVNIAARVEALTRQYGIDLLVADSTRAACGGSGWIEVDRLQVKGREQPVTVFTRVDGLSGGDERVKQLLQHWELALAAERLQHWETSRTHLSTLRSAPDLPFRLKALSDYLWQRIDARMAGAGTPEPPLR